MEIISKLVYALMILSAIGIVILVLLQHGKGADMGTGFGAGASGSLFGASGSANFLSRSTAVLAGTFFVCTLALSYFATNRPKAVVQQSDNLPAQVVPAPQSAPPAVSPAKPDAPAKGGEIPK